jgi:hypothetical protein
MRYLKIESLESKDKEWVDRDVIMLHSCFQILKDCVEQENVDTHCKYETNQDFVDEVRFLYQWWNDRINKEDSYEQIAEDNEMLLRLMKIRTSLWT